MVDQTGFFLNTKKIRTYGQSMEPFLLNGDVIYLKKKRFASIKVNDFVGLLRDKRLITHRVIFKPKNKNFLLTKGDNNPLPDKKVFCKQLIGVVEKIKRGKRLLNVSDLYLLQSSLYFQSLIELGKIFQEKNINFLILKGLPLHLYFEKNYPKRIYADCDFLIDKTQTKIVFSILSSLGFKKVNSPLSKIHSILKDKESEITFYKKVSGINIVLDIHLEAVFLMTQLDKLDYLYPQKLIDNFTKDLLNQKTSVRIQGSNFPILNLEHLIIYLSLHLFHHNFRGYNRYELINNILRSKKVDFQAVRSMMEKYRLNNFVYPVLYNLAKFYRSPIPKQFMLKILPNNSALNYIRRNILKISIFEDENRIESGKNRIKNIFYLSPNPIYIKLLTIFNPQVIYSIFWVLGQKLLIIVKRLNYNLTKIFLARS